MQSQFEYPCGCIIDTEKVKYKSITKNKKRISGYFCPEHGEKPTHKIEFCSECGRKVKREAPVNNKVELCGRCEQKETQNIIFKEPVRAFSVAEALKKGVRFINSSNLFRVNGRILNQ